MRRGFLRLLFCAVLPLLAVPARAQDVDPLDRFIGRPITGVRMEIETTPVTADALLSMLVVKTGDVLTLAGWLAQAETSSSVETSESFDAFMANDRSQFRRTVKVNATPRA